MANNQPNNTHHADKLHRKWLQRKWLSWLWNKQTFIFLFFLVLSTTFWLFQALNETYEEDFAIPIELRNVPGNVVVTTDLPNVVHVSLRDKGSVLLAYRYTHKFKSIVVDFTTYSNNNGYGAVQTAEVMRQIATQLVGSTQIVSIKPDTLEFYYNYGLCKRVPVVMQGKVGAGRLFSLANMLLGQDSVTVYAAKELLDTITAAYTQPLNLHGLTDTTRVSAPFMPVRGAKFVPNKVSVTFCVDRLVEKQCKCPCSKSTSRRQNSCAPSPPRSMSPSRWAWAFTAA